MISANGSQLRRRSEVSFVVMPWMSAAPDLLALSRMDLRDLIKFVTVFARIS